MKGLRFVLLFAVVGIKNTNANSLAQDFDKASYYKILKSGTAKEIDNELSKIEACTLGDKEAFKGALLMKKAGLVDIPKKKLDYFKSGRIKLETVLRDDSTNAEYRFLRLIIQEHAPKIVKYSSQLREDAAFIKKNYKTLSPDIQKIVIDYSQTSKFLKPQDFQS
ncbi:MAG TPA: hypothetical protein VFW07_02965 [Parafilimonas sp.]|nr:hypothetical protein [Parafilimonas sp.]